MRITVKPRENFSILHLRGEFDTFYCVHLQKEIDSLVAAGVMRIALNLRRVTFINSIALGAIIKASKTLAGEGGKLVIARPSTFCRDIMEKVGLNRVVPIFDTDDEAGEGLAQSVDVTRPKEPDEVDLDEESQQPGSPSK